jgi:hypothetical protein
MVGILGWVTMNPLVSSTVAGDQDTKWLHFVVVTIVPAEVAMHPHELTDLRLPPTRYLLFQRNRVVEAVARDHGEVWPD